jgi:hypothetical protein
VSKTLDDVVGELAAIRKSVDEIRLGQASVVQAVNLLVSQVGTSKAMEPRRAGWTLQ